MADSLLMQNTVSSRSPATEAVSSRSSAGAPSLACAGTLTVDALVDATPASRDRTVDLLRAMSIGVVVLWHWVFSITHWHDGHLTMPNPVGSVRGLWLLTWLLQVMPLFFVVGGYANLACWERRHSGAAALDGRNAGAFRRTRLQRLLRPVGFFLAVWAVVDIAGWSLGAPHVWTWGRVVFVPLWFLGMYLGVTLLAPWTARLHRSHRELPLVALAAAILLADLARFRFGWDVAAVANTAFVWLFAHQLGYWWRDGAITRRRAAALTIGGLTALVTFTNLGVYPRPMVATETDAISNMNPTTACIAALAVFQLGVVVLLRPILDRWVARRRVWKAVVAANGVAMTVFCWHMTALVLAIAAFHGLGGTLLADPTAVWWLERPLWLLLPGVFLAGLIPLFARVELRRRGP